MTLYELQLHGYRLTTAEIIYRLPDHPALLQSFIWQKFDLAPDYPELQRFLEFGAQFFIGIGFARNHMHGARRAEVTAGQRRHGNDADGNKR